MKKYVLLALVTLMTQAALAQAKGKAESMAGLDSKNLTCIVAVYKAEDMMKEEASEKDQMKTMKEVTVKIKNNEGEQEVVINGETLHLSTYKMDHSDVYHFSATLLTPVADRFPRASFVAHLEDKLMSDGPAKQTGFTAGYAPGGTTYEYIQYPSGKITPTIKFRKALEAQAVAELKGSTDIALIMKKGQEISSLASSQTVQNSYHVAEAVKSLVSKNLLTPSDVVAISTVFSCTMSK